MLEAAQHTRNSFVTLTYDEEHLPEDGSLNAKHGQDWIKRLRKRTEPFRLRYFFVGEYGDRTNRPHYHAALFGHGCDRGQSYYNKRGLNCCATCSLIQDTWRWGGVYLGSLNSKSAEYIGGYVTKKLTAKDDARLNGRAPEFARMSLKPGLGYSALHEVASVVMTYNLEVDGDVPHSLRHGPKQLPMGRYLTRNLRQLTGRQPGAPQSVVDKVGEELLDLRKAARASTEAPSLKQHVIKAGAAKVRSMETKAKIFKQERKL